MKRSLAISFAFAVTIAILTKGQPLYARKPQVGRATAAQVQRVACCVVTAISPVGVITAKENATGRTFEFQAGTKLMPQIHIGMPVYANFGTMQVSLDGTADCCRIISISPPPVAVAPAPAAKPASAAPPPPLPPATGTSGNSPASPPTKTNPPPGSGGATTQPGSKILANPSNLAIPRGTAPVSAPPASPAQVPTFSLPEARFVQDFQKGVTISDLTTGAVIYYTTDGSTPTTSSTRYSGPIPLSSTTTIKAMATASGMTNSAIGTITYTVCPAVSVLEGVDVSEYQGTTIDWNTVRASGRAFAYARASVGTSHLDSSFAQHYAAIKAAGLLRGAYHTFDATVDANMQANSFLSTIGTLQPGDLPPALDIEQQGTLYTGQHTVSVSLLQAGIAQWMTRVQAATGRTPIVYSAALLLQQALSSSTSGDPLWIVNWGVACPTLPAGSHQWVYWQYSSTGTVPGIPGAIDLNRFNGTLAGLNSLARLSSSQQQPPSSSGTSTSGTTASNVSPVINEIETDNSTVHQFIELFNPGGSAYDLKDHCVVFRSATATSDTLLVSFKTKTLIPSKGYLLLALPNSAGPTPNATYSSPIASAGGVVALRDGAANTGSVIDSVAYGSASNPFFVQTASAPSAQFPGTSISRWPNGSNTHNNSIDFKVSATPTPGQANK
jgi:lysozyme